MKVTFDIDTKTEFETLATLLKSLDIHDIHIVSLEPNNLPIITKGNKKLDGQSLFGIWRSNPQTLENIRKKGWLRNNEIE